MFALRWYFFACVLQCDVRKFHGKILPMLRRKGLQGLYTDQQAAPCAFSLTLQASPWHQRELLPPMEDLPVWMRNNFCIMAVPFHHQPLSWPESSGEHKSDLKPFANLRSIQNIFERYLQQAMPLLH